MSNTLGDMVVAITGDTTDFNLSIDAAGKKLDLLAQVTAKSAVDMTSSFKKIDNEVKLWGNSTDLITQKQQALKNEMTNLMNQGFDPLSSKVQSLKTQYSALENESKELQASQVTLQEKMVAVGTQMKSVGLAMSVGLTLPILGAAKAAVESSAQMEMLEASFTTFLGNADQASALMNNLIQMAAKTPFVTTDLASGAKMLLQYGIATKDVIPDLRMLGDISSGNTEIFNRLVYAFGQITSTGRLMGQDLRQMTEAGFNPLYVISQKTGESFQSLQKRMAAGGISAGEVADALKIATSEGGKFFKGMERGSLTFTGLVSTLKDNIGIMGRSMSDQFIPALKDIVKWLSNVAQWMTSLDPTIKSVIISLTAFIAVSGPLILVIGGVAAAIGTMTAASLAFMATAAPIILAIGAVVAIITLIGTKAAESKRQLDDLATAMKGTSDPTILNNALVSIEKQIKAQKDLIDVAKTRGVVGDALAIQEKKLADLQKQRSDISSQLYNVLKQGDNASLNSAEVAAAKEDEWTTKRKAAEASLASQFALIDEKQKAALASGEEYDAQSEKRKVLLETINKMLEEGFTFEGKGIQNLIESNLALMNGENARFEALNRMGQAYLDAQLANNEKIAEAENAKNIVLNQIGQIYLDRQAALKAWVAAVTAASAKESAITITNNEKINTIYAKSYTTFESIELAKGKLITELGVSEVDATKWANDQKEKIWADGLSMVSGTMDQISNIISNSNEASVQSLTKLGASIAAQFGPSGLIISGILNVVGSIFNLLNSTVESDAEVKKQLVKAQLDYEKTILQSEENIYNQQKSNLQLLTVAKTTQLDKEKNDALIAAGLTADTRQQDLKDDIIKINKQMATETDATEMTALKKQKIIDEYEIKKQDVLDASAKKQAEIDQKIFEIKIKLSIAQAKIDQQTAIASFKAANPDWFNNKLSSLAFINQAIAGIAATAAPYNELISLLQESLTIPQAAEGAIVNPTPSGTLIRVAEAKQPEVIFPLDQLNRFISKGFNTNNTINNSNDGNINLVVNLDSKPFLDKIFPATKNRTILISQGAIV